MRESYVSAAVGRVCLKRVGKLCTTKAEVCPEHRQRAKNYEVKIVVDEEDDSIVEVKCESCAASEGGCKQGLAFLMWLFQETSKPSPTEVKSYWNKPKLSNVPTNRIVTCSDFGQVPNIVPNDADEFFAEVAGVSVGSCLQRYCSDIDEISQLDLHQLAIKFVVSKGNQGPFSPHNFRGFCKGTMKEDVCVLAFTETKEQSESRYWSLLRYGRITASNLYTTAHSQSESGGVMKEIILGASTLPLTNAMKRRQNLEPLVLKIVQEAKRIVIERVGIKLNCGLPEFGASPDGLTEDYVIEVKSPQSEKTFPNYVRNGSITPKYMAQVQLQMKMCNRSKALYCVAHPDFETSNKVTIIEVHFDENHVNNLISRATQFSEEHIFPVLMSSARI